MPKFRGTDGRALQWVSIVAARCPRPLKPGEPVRYRPGMNTDLRAAIAAALAGDWERAHAIVQQDEDDPLACWIHAVVHKVEGDAGNSRYWYSRSQHAYSDYSDPQEELAAIKKVIEST